MLRNSTLEIELASLGFIRPAENAGFIYLEKITCITDSEPPVEMPMGDMLCRGTMESTLMTKKILHGFELRVGPG